MAMVQHSSLGRPLRPIVSICIANYNGESLLTDCVDSVLAQEYDGSVEVIVHDDASSDGSIALLHERYPWVERLISDENVGFCIANNRMVAHARGEYILLLNNDAALLPNALAKLIATACKQSTPGILTLPQYDWESGALVDRGCLLDPFYNPVPNLDPERREVAYVIGACLWIPRVVWNELGGFPEWIESIGEDMYLCCLARLRAIPVRALSTSGYRHRQGASFGGNRVDKGRLVSTFRRRYLSERNKAAVLVLCTPTPLAWPLLAIHLFLLLVEGALITLIKRDRRIWSLIYAPVITSLTRGLATLRVRRIAAQSQRQMTLCGYLTSFTLSPRKLRMFFRHGLPAIK